MEVALAVSEPTVWETVPMMLPRLFCICCMARASEPIWSEEWMSSSAPVRSPEAMASARSATRSMLRVMRRARRNERMPPMSAPRMVAVHRVMRTARLRCAGVAISASHWFSWDFTRLFSEARRVDQRENLNERSAGLACGCGRVHSFSRSTSSSRGRSWARPVRNLLNDGGIAAEIVVAAQIEELGERRRPRHSGRPGAACAVLGGLGSAAPKTR